MWLRIYDSYTPVYYMNLNCVKFLHIVKRGDEYALKADKELLGLYNSREQADAMLKKVLEYEYSDQKQILDITELRCG